MYLENFHYLLEVERLKSVSSAARSLNLRQSTLSSIINVLEKDLGYSVFYRTPDGMIPTREGKRLLSVARDVDIKVEELYSLSSKERGHARPINIVMSPGACMSSLIDISQQYFKFDLPGDILVEERHRLEIPVLLAQHVANVGIAFFTMKEVDDMASNPKYADILVTPFFRTRFCVLASREHPVAKRGCLTLEDFQNNLFCDQVTCSTARPDTQYESLLPKKMQSISVNSYAIMKRLLLEKNMLSLATWYTICNSGLYDPEKMVAIPLSSDLAKDELCLCMLHRPEQKVRYQERILFTCIDSYFKNYILPPMEDFRHAEKEVQK